ncbi:MAG: hypothetical protein JZD41_07700 [Thermoproteus sp.]|nr:hypothetical protein [Thermoproteus sp.]
MSVSTYVTRGRYTEVEINRNILFYGASNANSRTLKVRVRNTDIASHQYTVVAVTGTENWSAGLLSYTYAIVSLGPNEVTEVDLDIANASTTPPNSSATYTAPALNVFVDTATTPDVVMWPLWVLNVSVDKLALITFNETAKYIITGSGSYSIPGTTQTVTQYFYIADVANEDYVPINTMGGTTINNGIIIAINPLDKTGAAVNIATITSQGPGTYQIALQPITTGYLKIGVDIVVNYSALGNYLGTAMSWLTLLGADVVSVFLNNKYIQYLFLSQINPLLTHYFGSQNITMNAYQDPNNPNEVHIVLYTNYNVNDDPELPLAIILAIIIAVIIGVVAISWTVVSVTEAEVQKERITYMKQAESDFYSLMTNPNLSNDLKMQIARYYRAAVYSISQFSGVVPCQGLAVGNTCIPWWVFAIIAAVLALILVLKA